MTNVQLAEAFSGLFEPHRYKAFYGGRGSGKSHSAVTALVLKAAERPLRILCCREVQNSIRESVKAPIERRIEEMGLSDHFEILDAEIRSKNGGKFIFGGLRSNPDSIKSMDSIDIAWVEEAQRASQKSLDLLIPTIRQPGSEIWFTWNPVSASDPVDVMFRGPHGPPPDTLIRQVNWDANPWFPPVLRQEMEYDRKRDPDKWAHIWNGAYQEASEARVFRNWRIEDFETPKDSVLRFGADWGFAVDPTVLVRCWVEGRTLYVDYEAYRVGCEIVDTPSLFLSVPDSERWPIVADSSRPETVSYMRQNGFPKIVPAVKGARSVEEGVEWLKSHDIVIHPRCQRTIDEIRSYSYKVDAHTGAILPVLSDKDNHVIDALRYACEGLRRAPVKAPPAVNYVPTKTAWSTPLASGYRR